MADTFLRSVAGFIAEKFPQKEEDICLVFTNRRAKLFYQRELGLINHAVSWLPEILSMEDFVERLTDNAFCDPLLVLFEFFEVYKKSEGEQAETFEQFSTWASQLLHDYEETDLFLVDAAKLFRHVDEAYALKNWSPDGTVISRHQEQYLRFWSKMAQWYQELRKALVSKGLMTQAIAFRYVAENIEKITDTLPWNHILFAGFNALNKAEARFINVFEKRGIATLYWDVDRYYLDNELNEAGYFMRKNMYENSRSILDNTINRLGSQPKKIHITGVAKNTGQAVYAGGILQHLNQSDAGLNDTALVLCDEQLLVPVLESLPAELNRVNVTMGYPLYLLPEAGIFQLLFELQAHTRSSRDQTLWYFKDFIRLLQHPLLEGLLPATFINNANRKIQDQRHIFVSLDWILKNTDAPLAENEHKLLAEIFCFWDDKPQKAFEQLNAIIILLAETINTNKSEKGNLQKEALFSISTLVKRLQSYHETYNSIDTVKSLGRMFEQQLRQHTLSFYGEPLDGLQIMGMLETRNLDFKNLILLSVNEGILPKGKTQTSFIPLDISTVYGLPTYRERDAVYAWHFYRLLQRAENIWLIYNTEPDEFAKGEKSRFIAQIEEEMNHPDIELIKDTWVPDILIPEEPEIIIEKTPELINQLTERFDKPERFLSPSALSCYLNCSLQFYFKYLSGVRIEETLDEEIGADMLGTVVHHVLQEFFTPFIGKYVSQADYQQMLQRLPDSLKSSFVRNQIAEDDLMQGKNLLVYRGAEQMLQNYLEAEMNMLKEDGSKLKILKLEHPLVQSIEVAAHLDKLMLGGFADRIDELDGTIRIIDYKTGKVDSKKLKIENPNDILEKDDMGKALQLMIYSYLAQDLYPDKMISAGIISLRESSKGLLELVNNSEKEDIKIFFQQIFSDILNPEKPFEKTDDWSRCKYCDFKTVCNRQMAEN